MLNRNLLRHRFAQWANNTFFIVSLEDAVWKSSKTIARRRLRNAFNKYRAKVQELKRIDYIRNKVDWFGDVRDKKLLENCIDAWKNFI
jgi:citrate lyase beta subunit